MLQVFERNLLRAHRSKKIHFLVATMLTALPNAAWAQSAATTGAKTAPEPTTAAANSEQDIVVTAGRRDQSIVDVPYNISALSSATLEKTGARSLNDIVKLVPGLMQSDSGPALYGSGNNVVMRGLNAQGTLSGGSEQIVSAVSTYLGNIPIFFPLTITDVERVEVLRGPQGTLYGSGAVGGTLRFIPKAPRFDRLEIEAGASGGISEHSGTPNYSFDGVINVPISDRAALRLAGSYEKLGGFIDEVALMTTQNGAPVPRIANDPNSGFLLRQENDTNWSKDWFGRAEFRWEATDNLTANVFYQHQQTATGDVQASNPFWTGGKVDFSSENFPGSRYPNPLGLPGGGMYPNGFTSYPAGGEYKATNLYKEPYERKVDVAALDLTYDLGFASVSSTTSYSDNRVSYTDDQGFNYMNVTSPDGFPLIAFYNYFPRLTAITYYTRRSKVFTQELRLASQGKDNRFDYVFGGYYSKENSHYSFDQFNPGLYAYYAATGFPDFILNPTHPDENWFVNRNISFEDKALFGELTWHVNSRWQVTAGGRIFWQKFSNDFLSRFYVCGPHCGDGVSPNQNFGESDVNETRSFHDHIIKLNTSYELNRDLRLYATYSEGFRRGGANTLSTSGFFASLPSLSTFKPDFARNYEVGIKGRLDHLNFTLSAYQIDWKNYQFEGINPSFIPAVFNGDKARSRGIEAEISGNLTSRLSISAGYAFTDAKLTSDFEILDLPQYAVLTGQGPIVSVSGESGQRLPGSPKHSASASVNYTIPLPSLGGDKGPWALTLGVNGNYRSDVIAGLPTKSAFYYSIPSSAQGDLMATLSREDGLSFGLAVRNFTNSLGRTTGLPAEFTGPFTRANVARPRTFTFSAHWKY